MNYKDSVDIFLKVIKSYDIPPIDLIKRDQELLDKWKAAMSARDSLKNKFQPMPVGYAMMHSFRSKNNQGNVVIDSFYFKMDSSFVIKRKYIDDVLNKN